MPFLPLPWRTVTYSQLPPANPEGQTPHPKPPNTTSACHLGTKNEQTIPISDYFFKIGLKNCCPHNHLARCDATELIVIVHAIFAKKIAPPFAPRALLPTSPKQSKAQVSSCPVLFRFSRLLYNLYPWVTEALSAGRRATTGSTVDAIQSHPRPRSAITPSSVVAQTPVSLVSCYLRQALPGDSIRFRIRVPTGNFPRLSRVHPAIPSVSYACRILILLLRYFCPFCPLWESYTCHVYTHQSISEFWLGEP